MFDHFAIYEIGPIIIPPGQIGVGGVVDIVLSMFDRQHFILIVVKPFDLAIVISVNIGQSNTPGKEGADKYRKYWNNDLLWYHSPRSYIHS